MIYLGELKVEQNAVIPQWEIVTELWSPRYYWNQLVNFKLQANDYCDSKRSAFKIDSNFLISFLSLGPSKNAVATNFGQIGGLEIGLGQLIIDHLVHSRSLLNGQFHEIRVQSSSIVILQIELRFNSWFVFDLIASIHNDSSAAVTATALIVLTLSIRLWLCLRLSWLLRISLTFLEFASSHASNSFLTCVRISFWISISRLISSTRARLAFLIDLVMSPFSFAIWK